MFSDWLRLGFILIAQKPLFWCNYCLFLFPLLAIGSLSQVVGIVIAVICLFVGVGIACYCDTASPVDKSADSLNAAIKQSLPLALIAGLGLMLCWFVFRLVADISTGHLGRIIQFFWDLESWNATISEQSWRVMAGKMYAVAMVALIFTLLMLTTFGNWFSFPLMVFKDSRWSAAKQLGNQAAREHRKGMSNLMLFLGVTMVLGLSVMPILTPVVYALTSILMYISYREVFTSTRDVR